MKFRATLLFFFVGFISLCFGTDYETVKHDSQQKTQSVRDESQEKVERILARFAEFKSELKELKPGLTIALPVDAKNASKMRIIDHNELTGIPETPKMFAVVNKDYTLKTWHSDTDSQNLEKVKAGEKVEVVMLINPRTQDNPLTWALIRRANETEGYIPQSYLTNSAAQEQPNSVKKEMKYVVSSAGLRMRDEPSLAGNFVQLVPSEAELEVTQYSRSKETIDGLSDYWAYTEFAGKKGWLFNGYLRPLASKPATPVGAGGFLVPVKGFVSSPFGSRIDPVTKKAGTFHRGVDIAAPQNTPIHAAKDGTVFEKSNNKYWGNYIILKHEDNVYTYYCHQTRTKSPKGSKVKAGDVIGYVGKTGKATGFHLHFEVRVGQDPKDPLRYLK